MSTHPRIVEYIHVRIAFARLFARIRELQHRNRLTHQPLPFVFNAIKRELARDRVVRLHLATLDGMASGLGHEDVLSLYRAYHHTRRSNRESIGLRAGDVSRLVIEKLASGARILVYNGDPEPLIQVLLDHDEAEKLACMLFTRAARA